MAKNPQYKRLMLNGQFVGVGRTMTEFLPAGGDLWQLEPIDYNPDESVLLSQAPFGLDKLPSRKKKGVPY